MTTPEFVEFPKIARLRRAIILTEKIDGTNACVHVPEDPGAPLIAGSRTRWISPESDNHGFAAWVRDHAEELRGLGPGTHFGEWWGAGIQRRYGLDHKRWSLFNVGRWDSSTPEKTPPACCNVVPVLGRFDTFDMEGIRHCVQGLQEHGSAAAPGFLKPEGVVIFHVAGGHLYKQTLEKDEQPKTLHPAAIEAEQKRLQSYGSVA